MFSPSLATSSVSLEPLPPAPMTATFILPLGDLALWARETAGNRAVPAVAVEIWMKNLRRDCVFIDSAVVSLSAARDKAIFRWVFMLQHVFRNVRHAKA